LGGRSLFFGVKEGCSTVVGVGFFRGRLIRGVDALEPLEAGPPPSPSSLPINPETRGLKTGPFGGVEVITTAKLRDWDPGVVALRSKLGREGIDVDSRDAPCGAEENPPRGGFIAL
jgi:hypothetical protein